MDIRRGFNCDDDTASVEMQILETGDRVELYKWEFPFSSSGDLFPFPLFKEGTAFSTGEKRFVSKLERGSFFLEVPRPVVDSQVSWSLEGSPELTFVGLTSHRRAPLSFGPRRRAAEVKCLMALKIDGWPTGGPRVYELVQLQGWDTRNIDGFKFACKFVGKVKPGTNNLNNLIPVLFNAPDLSDVELVCGGETFYCHKVGSPVFKAMFTSYTKEAQENSVEIQDVNKDTLKLMLEWMYGGDILPKMKECNNNMEGRMDLFKLADRYLLDHLKEILVEDMVDSLKPETAFEVYIFGETYGEEKLKKKAKAVLKTVGIR